MNIIRDIQSLTLFKRDASKIIKRMQQTKEPLVLTVNGKAAAVVQDAESYQRLIEGREHADTVRVLRERIQHLVTTMKGRTSEEFFDILFSEQNMSSE